MNKFTLKCVKEIAGRLRIFKLLVKDYFNQQNKKS